MLGEWGSSPASGFGCHWVILSDADVALNNRPESTNGMSA